MYYIRKIEAEKWDEKPNLDIASLDDIISDDGEVSVWMEEGTKYDIYDYTLAYLLSRRQITDVWCVRIPSEVVVQRKLKVAPKESSTPYKELSYAHANILIPSLYELGDVAEIIYEEIHKGNLKYIEEQKLKERLYKLINEQKIQVDLTNKEYKKIRIAYNEIDKLNKRDLQ